MSATSDILSWNSLKNLKLFSEKKADDALWSQAAAVCFIAVFLKHCPLRPHFLQILSSIQTITLDPVNGKLYPFAFFQSVQRSAFCASMLPFSRERIWALWLPNWRVLKDEAFQELNGLLTSSGRFCLHTTDWKKNVIADYLAFTMNHSIQWMKCSHTWYRPLCVRIRLCLIAVRNVALRQRCVLMLFQEIWYEYWSSSEDVS